MRVSVSYILEALKKSEQDRKKSESPNFYSIESAVLPERNRRNIWAWFFMGLLLLNLSFFASYLFWKYQSKVPQAQEAVLSAPIKSESLAPVQAQAKPPVALQKNYQQEREIVTAKAVIRTHNNAPEQTQIVNDEAQFETIGPQSRRYAESLQVDEEEPNKLPSPYDLPKAVQSALPSLHFDSHMYSSDGPFRSVIVNGQLLKEGEFIEEGLMLVEITESGVILNFNGHIFSMPVVQGWVNETSR